jgi:hypothetical protein
MRADCGLNFTWQLRNLAHQPFQTRPGCVSEAAVWPLLVIFRLFQLAIFLWASNRFVNQLTRRHSSRNLPWKLSTCAFRLGLRGWIWRTRSSSPAPRPGCATGPLRVNDRQWEKGNREISSHKPTRYECTPSMSPIRGDVKEKSSPSPPREMDVVACIQPISVLERLWACRAFRTDQASGRLLLDSFMTRWWFDAFGSGSYASRSVG